MEKILIRLSLKLQAAGKAATCKDEYALLKTDEERFLYSLRLLQQYNVEQKIDIEKKNSSVSELYRQQGNRLFVSTNANDNIDEILELYNKSIIYAEENSQQLAYAYGNRSALLFKARLYEHCLRDIDRAVKSNCPPNLKVKLSIRRAQCLMANDESERRSISNVKRREKIDEATIEAQKLIEQLTIDDTLKKKFYENLKNSEKKNWSKIGKRQMFDEEKLKPSAPMDNPELPGVSAALEISYDEKFGRHVTATRKIFPGEILSVQRGYATILAPEHFHNYCSNCLRRTWSGISCDNCVEAFYCDENCRADALDKHHDVECGVVGAMLKLEFNLLGLMSLRLAIRAVRDAGGFEALKKKIEDIESSSDPRTKGFVGTPPILDETDYASVYTLATNTEKRSGPDLFGRSCNSVFIVLCVATLTEFLGEKLNPDYRAIEKNRWAVFLGGLLTRHQQIIPSNVHTVNEMKGLDDRERGASMIPFLSYFNHSCHCMVTRIHYGTDVVLRALETIEPGQQVYDNYGMHHAMKSRLTRQLSLLKQFFFTCECRACNGDWPVFFNLPSCMRQRLDRGRILKVQKALKNLHEYIEISTNCEIVGKLHIVRDTELMLKILYENVDLPCREVSEVVETLKRMYSLLSNRYQSLRETSK